LLLFLYKGNSTKDSNKLETMRFKSKKEVKQRKDKILSLF
jgi:hypothetical protein